MAERATRHPWHGFVEVLKEQCRAQPQTFRKLCHENCILLHSFVTLLDVSGYFLKATVEERQCTDLVENTMFFTILPSWMLDINMTFEFNE